MNWSYIAGLIDGEGTIIKSRQRDSYRVRVCIDITHKQVLEEIQNYCKLGKIYTPKKRKEHWKQNYIYAIQRHEDVEIFLRKIKPYLIIKKTQCEYILEQIKNKKWSGKIKLNKKRLLALREEGKSLREIAKKMNVGHETVRKRLNEMK